jgi:8-oxo-dGTP pyrophosphatase MutT (NUDIX family)
MHIDELMSRLATIPERLPAMPRELMPVALGAADEETPRLPRFPDESRREAAVLMLFYPGPDKDAYLILTERSPGEHRHAGQISLPGGAIDPEDASIEEAALREAFEEVGLDVHQASVTVHGVLPVVDVRVSGFLVHPVIAFAERTPELTPDGYEVAAIIHAPLAAFLAGAPIEVVTADMDGFRLRYGGYRIGEHHVWGATAMMLGRLGAYLSEVSARPSIRDRGA